MSLIETVQQHLGPAEIQQISQQLGVDPTTAEQAVQAALPSLVAGMAGHAQQPAGQQSIDTLMNSHGGVLGNLGGLLAGAATGDGGILGNILGRHSETVNQDVQQKSGLDSAKTRQLLMILGPIILAALAHRKAQAKTPSDIGSVLKKEGEKAESRSPRMGGILGKILDQVESPEMRGR